MVKEEIKKGEKYFMCEECDFYYKDKSWAEKCENFCKKNKGCSMEITKHSVKI